jgi:Uma2 family endonuclease
MTDPTRTTVGPPPISVDAYFRLVETGALSEDDRVELLEGVVVAMAPRNARHDAAVSLTHEALREAIGREAAIRGQCALVIGVRSVPEPDVAVVPGALRDYDTRHPTTALLVVEVADSSLPQDRLTKARLYAAAEIPEYWIVNLRDDRLEVSRDPDPAAALYRETRNLGPGERVSPVAFPAASVAVADLLPAR